MSSGVASNGGMAGPAPGRLAGFYSEVQTSRLNHPLPLPSVLKAPFKVVDGPPSSAAGNPDEIAKLFPKVFGQPSAMLVPTGSAPSDMAGTLKIGVVLSGGQAPGGHNVISGIFDYLQEKAKGSTMYGFKGGPAGIMKGKYVELTPEFIYPYRNQGGFDMICSGRDKIETPEQFKQAEDTAKKLDLDGLVVIGGDDSNTNACLLAENFRQKNMKTRVIGCPKTIDGDLKCKEVPTSFGFDTACKIYAEMIGNVMTDARSTGKYYHFVRLMGRAASHITLECALQTHPNVTIIGEEVSAKKQTLKSVTDHITDVICKRAELGYNYGVILIPEGLIDFIPEVQQLIAELNEILAHDVVDEAGLWKKKLRNQTQVLFDFLPQAIQEQLLLERDPHGNVQVARIETEKMLIQMVEIELEKRKSEGNYSGHFKGQSHFFGYEGRCGLPTNFDSTYCYALGYAAGALLQSGKTGLISSVGNLCAPVEEWTVGGTALTALMDVERRHGKFKPVIKKAMVELEGAPFRKFASMREEWALKNRYISPGPIQFFGPGSDGVNDFEDDVDGEHADDHVESDELYKPNDAANNDFPEADRVRKEYEDSKSKLSNIQSRISRLNEKLKHDFGRESEFYSFYNRCFENKQSKYVYKVCPFKQASQVEGHRTTRLGKWEKFDKSYRAMRFSNGDGCWNGPDRSLKVRLRCGLTDELTDIDEPSRCEYVALLSTPALCREDKLKELQHKLEQMNTGQPQRKDEL